MAFRKRPAEGENPGGFRSILPGQAGGDGIGLDPTQGPPSGSGVPTVQDVNGERWGKIDRGSRDNSGSRHDW